MVSDFGQGVPRDEVTAVLSTMEGGETELSRRLLDKILLENADDVIHVLSLKGLFLYLSPACRRVLEYDASELVGTALSAICHPSDIVPVTRELKDNSNGTSVSVVFRIRRKRSGYMWFESHGSLHTEQGKGRKCIILVGRERPVYTLNKSILNAAGGIGENELWTKMSTAGMFLYVSSNVRQLLDRQPEDLVGTNVQSLMRPDSKEEFGRVLTLALTGKNTSVRHELTNKRGQVLQAFSWLYPGDAVEGQKPTFLVAQIRLIRYHRGTGQRPTIGTKGDQQSSTGSIPSQHSNQSAFSHGSNTPMSTKSGTIDNSNNYTSAEGYPTTTGGQHGLAIGRQDASLASDDNVFDELKTTRSTSWQFELRQMEKRNRILAEEVQSLIAAKKKRKRRRGAGLLQKDCANCHTKQTPEWRRGPSGQRDLCNSCGLRWAKQVRLFTLSFTTLNSFFSHILLTISFTIRLYQPFSNECLTERACFPPKQRPISPQRQLQGIGLRIPVKRPTCSSLLRSTWYRNNNGNDGTTGKAKYPPGSFYGITCCQGCAYGGVRFCGVKRRSTREDS
jgi:PAS domain S-box-containing protein